MTIYRRRGTITTSGGTGSIATSSIRGGLCNQVYIKAATSGVAFRADLTDEDGTVVRSYAWHRDEINETGMHLPVVGVYTVRVTDATANGDFTAMLAVEE